MISIIGRDSEITLINTLLQQKRNILVFGEEGIGKSAIIQRIISDKDNRNILYVQKNNTLRETLIGIVTANLERISGYENFNILALKKKCYEIIDKTPGYLVLDHMGRVEPKHYAFLTYLLEKNIPLLIISRGLNKKDIGHLRMSLYSFGKVEIKSFDKKASNNLTDYFIKEFGIKVVKTDEFKQAIFNYSKGNTKIIKALCFLARDVKYQKNDSIDVKLIDLDRRITEAVR